MNENPNITRAGETALSSSGTDLEATIGILSEESQPPRIRRIKDLPEEERPRERLLLRGAETLTDAELIGLLFGTGVRGLTAVDLGRDALARAGGLRGLERESPAVIAARRGVGPSRAARLSAAIELGRRISAQPLDRGVKIDSWQTVVRRYGPLLAGLPRERFYALLLDSRGRLIRDHLVSEGTVGEAFVHMREVFLPAIQEGAAGVICLHNHPSGDPTPSALDLELTDRLAEAGDLLGIRLLDHIVVAGARGVSIAAMRGTLARRLTERGGADSISPANGPRKRHVGEDNAHERAFGEPSAGDRDSLRHSRQL